MHHSNNAQIDFAITGWGTALPEGVLTNHDLEQRVETTDEWVTERTGIKERRFALDGDTTSSLAVAAGAAAIKKAGLVPGDIDLMVMATTTPDQIIPHTGSFVGDGIGLRCGSFDLNAACAGFVYALVVGASMLTTGNLRHVLVVGAETLSRVVDPLDRGTCILFGDGAAAFVISRIDDDGSGADPAPGILAWDLGCDGSLTSILEVPAGGTRKPATHETVDAREHFITMNGPEVFRKAVRVIVDTATATLERADVPIEDVKWFAPHQANIRIIDSACGRIGMPMERTLVNIERYGNTSAASIPLVLAEAADDGRLQDGDLVLLSGFGAGMTWASALLRWGHPKGK
ncbi:MAG: beta-ketoacyl-ACP synthase III [Acidimicrobiia bacterium]